MSQNGIKCFQMHTMTPLKVLVCPESNKSQFIVEEKSHLTRYFFLKNNGTKLNNRSIKCQKIMQNVKNSQRNQKIIKYNSLESQNLDFLSYKMYLDWSNS